MKLSVIALLSVSTLVTAARTPPQKGCADPRTATPWYRTYKDRDIDHYYTANLSEYQNAVNRLGFIDEGVALYVFKSAEPSTVPLYKVYKRTPSDPIGNDHFYTTNPTEKDNAVNNLGYVDEGITGYIYPDNECGGVPLYRSYHTPGVDHLYTTSADEWDSAAAQGWAKEWIEGYVLPY